MHWLLAGGSLRRFYYQQFRSISVDLVLEIFDRSRRNLMVAKGPGERELTEKDTLLCCTALGAGSGSCFNVSPESKRPKTHTHTHRSFSARN